MILTLDVGNSQIFGGVFDNHELTLRFRKTVAAPLSSDEFGLFLRSVLRENGSDSSRVDQIAFCSVVPDVIYSLRSCCRKYFGLDPFILQPGVKTGLKIRYRNPLEVGPDRIANVIGAMHRYPDRNLVIVDFGTATTFDVVRAPRDYLGGIILAGLRIAMEALENNTARLPTVEIVPASTLVGRSTVESIQSGLYFGTRAAVTGLTREIREQAFSGEPVLVIGTGGLSRLFEHDKVFDVLLPDLVLIGLERALSLNEGASRTVDGDGPLSVSANTETSEAPGPGRRRTGRRGARGSIRDRRAIARSCNARTGASSISNGRRPAAHRPGRSQPKTGRAVCHEQSTPGQAQSPCHVAQPRKPGAV